MADDIGLRAAALSAGTGAFPVPDIHGYCAPAFGAVKDAFADNFRAWGEIGAAVAVFVDGEPVVDLWAGYQDPALAVPWEADTLVCVNSITKEVTALALHILIERGLVDLDAPVARYWPEFAQAGKEALPVRYLLDHRAGLPYIDGSWRGMAYDWEAMVAGLARQQPTWEPGTTPCYHAVTFGYLVGEVIRRVTGQSPGTFIREAISEPLGIDFHMPTGEAAQRRCASLIRVPGNPNQAKRVGDPASLYARMWNTYEEVFDNNSKTWREAEMPSVNGHSNARALARLSGALARGGELDGVRICQPETLALASRRQWEQVEALGRYYGVSLGFLLPTQYRYMGPSPRAYLMSGNGGFTAGIDPDNRIGLAYTMNLMDTASVSPRSQALTRAIFKHYA